MPLRSYIRKALYALLLVLLVSQTSPSSVWAISDAQRQALDSGILYFNTDGNGLSGGGSCAVASLPTITDAAALGTAIDQFVRQNGGTGSPFDGLGASIVEGAQRAGINPLLVVAIAREESSFGTAIPPNSFNAFGRTAAPGQPSVTSSGRQWYQWTSWQNSVDSTDGNDEADFLQQEYVSKGLVQIADVILKYAPPSDGNNTAQYIANLNLWINQMVSAAGSSMQCGGLSGSVRDKVVQVASQELALWQSGQMTPGSSFYKYSENRPEDWCADFVSWVYNQAGYPFGPAGTYDGNWNVSYTGNFMVPPQDSGKFVVHPAAGYTPQPGDVALHSTSGNPWYHTNLVLSVSGSTITMIGGNQGGGNGPGVFFRQSKVSTYPISSPTQDDIVYYISPSGS